jgi:transporter family-2 protein
MIYYIISLLAGLAVAIQAGINAQLQQVIKNQLVSAFISFGVGITALFLLILFTNPKSFQALGNTSQASWWQLTGGLLGAFYICSLIFAIPKIGAANMLGFVVASQLIFAVVFDHFGWIGFPVHQINWQRLLGIGFLVAGLYFVKK